MDACINHNQRAINLNLANFKIIYTDILMITKYDTSNNTFIL